MNLQGHTAPSASPKKESAQFTTGLSRRFSKEGVDPYTQFEWELRTAEIKNAKTGEIVFRADNLEFPKNWSQNATDIVAEKYFRHVEQPDGTLQRETSVRQMVGRVVGTLCFWGTQFGYFSAVQERIFHDELVCMLLNQSMAFNSPVWFNIGTKRGRLREEQASACFIVGLDDHMDSILELGTTEGKLYKGGSGSGVNYSKLRSSREKLSGGGTASGPVPFIAKDDSNAGAIKSGGTTRRAAKMAILNVDHGDILEFINCKSNSEKMAHALIDAGFDGDFRARWGAYQSVPFQNANHSVRVTDEFMQAVENDLTWTLRQRDGEPIEVVMARKLWDAICDAAHVCGDPGLQFDTITNLMHTCPADGRINGSNPCCVVGDTLVDTAEGKIAISVLEEMSRNGEVLPYVFAWDTDTNLPVLRKINRAWVAGETNNLIDVVTDKGVRVRCTPDHRFLLRDGSYVPAKDLRPGDRLRKISRGINKNRSKRRQIYHRVVSQSASGPYDTVWQNRFIWEQINGSIPVGMEVHHINEDATDDRISNFELVAAAPHRSAHSTGLKNSNSVNVSPAALVEVWEDIERTRGSVSVWRWNKYIRDNKLHGFIPQAQSPTTGGRVHGMLWDKFSEWIDNHRTDVNDRVSSVSMVDSENVTRVYDLEVDGVHNFAVGDALHTIVIHNSEYMHLDNTACNLASINLCAFQHSQNGMLNVDSFQQTVDVAITAMDILIDGASYPTQLIQDNAHKYRQLGLGYTNLGAFFMAQGIPYDSDRARNQAALITAIMCGRAYQQSAVLAGVMGPFEGYTRNGAAMAAVIERHAAAVPSYITNHADRYLSLAAIDAWREAKLTGLTHGYRNSQATVLAPTGTISFLMDADTTGIEPDLSLVKHKKLVGGAAMKMVNQGIPRALRTLGYTTPEQTHICTYMTDNGSMVGSGLLDEHLPVFDSSFPDPVGGRFLRPEAHILMMAAVQPFLSGAISKTCNIPRETSVEEISRLYMLAWKSGLKSIALYRDGSKYSQPLQSAKSQDKVDTDLTDQLKKQLAEITQPRRRRLPDERQSLGHKFTIGNHEGYIHAGTFEDGQVGEMFIRMSKEGSTVSGLMDTIATLTSVALQYGVPLDALVKKFRYASFEPAGWTGNPEIHHATSIVDYVFRWLELKFTKTQNVIAVVDATASVPVKLATNGKSHSTGQICPDCGHVTQRAGSCFTCSTCGWNGGCG